jgi:beta-lactam-binding protein with PASTA domain
MLLPPGAMVTYQVGIPEGGTTTTTTAGTTTTTTAGTTTTTTAGTTTTTAAPPAGITLDNYKGRQCSAVRTELQGLGLQVGPCKFGWYATLDSGKVGTVDSQEPAAGTRVPPGSTVKLWQLVAPADESECDAISGHWRDGGCYSTP